MKNAKQMAAAAAVAAVALAATGCTSTAGADDASATGRVAVAYEGGIAVLDSESLEILGEFDTEEFTRLNSAGDGRNVMVTTSAGFQVLDTGAPALTDLVFEAATAGHVVSHAGKTVLFDDGTGDTTIYETDALDPTGAELPESTVVPADYPHHGVSVELSDGTLLTTIGDEESRSGAFALNADGEEIARSEDCPGVHGEGTVKGEAVVFGCEDGALIYHDGEFDKLDAPDEFGRMGNAYVSETSELIVGDYKNDPDAEGLLLDKVTLIDTAEHTYRVVDLPEGVKYTYRDIVRGPEENAYILSVDGSIHVLDPATGDITDEYPVIGAWEEPAEWQSPHPTFKVNGDTGYVTEPAKNTVHAVDLTTGEITASVELEHAPNELAVATD
ncbi:zinc metallochaperone AztD [Zhihengliuella halotolerans]|uniref:zinc metallochaperone AztD n=1 Tax=Zhihengliuella halotolerans TaxID=370736 RepID=UPI000C7F8D05|nr:zinc metallochaperone AztD [Zhihengliuella halotolerans]